jgi:hypothetical protein
MVSFIHNRIFGGCYEELFQEQKLVAISQLGDYHKLFVSDNLWNESGVFCVNSALGNARSAVSFLGGNIL